MPKQCKVGGCTFNVFGKGFCKRHQYLRVDIVKSIPKKKKKEKHTDFGFNNQTELFEYIWNTREHKSEISGDNLLPKSHDQWHWQMLHVLPKGSYPYYKLNPNNILLGTIKEHDNQEDYEVFVLKKERLLQEYYKKYYNKKY